jgi:hypothetical protein
MDIIELCKLLQEQTHLDLKDESLAAILQDEGTWTAAATTFSSAIVRGMNIMDCLFGLSMLTAAVAYIRGYQKAVADLERRELEKMLGEQNTP